MSNIFRFYQNCFLSWRRAENSYHLLENKTRPTSYKNPDVSFRLLIMEIPVLSIAEIGLQNESHPKLDALTVTLEINILHHLSLLFSSTFDPQGNIPIFVFFRNVGKT